MNKALLLTVALGFTLHGAQAGFGTNIPNSRSAKFPEPRVVIQNQISGVVRDGNGPVSGISVAVVGTNLGTQTDQSGRFSISAPTGSTLRFSAIGYQSKDVLATSNQVQVILERSDAAIDEVVVTAMGIKKEKKALGYAVQDIKADELMKNKNPNMINSLNGKIAGLNITNSGGSPGASASIVIRGGTSLERDNQPLFVIDGMPMDNSTGVGDMSQFDGNTNISTTNGNRAMDINPDDIESISVLKGPTAAALYGIRAAAGAIVITTKKGKDGVASIGVSSRVGTNTVNKLPELQKRYKQGTNLDGAGVDPVTYLSWGDQFAPGEVIYNNLEDFFKTGVTYDNSFNVSGGNAKGNFYLSGANVSQSGIVPTTDYNRTNFRFNGEQKVGILTFGANAAYSESKTTKTLTGTGLWGSGGNGYMESIIAWPQSANMKDWRNPDGSQKLLVSVGNDQEEILLGAIDNPYWTVNMNPQNDKTNRFLGTFYTNAKLTDWLDFTYRLGVDNYTSTYTSKISAGSAVIRDYQKGMLSQNIRQYNFLTNNFLLNSHKVFADVWDVNLLLGASSEDISSKSSATKAQNFVVPGFYSFNNAKQEDKFLSDNVNNIRRFGVFGDLKVGYKNMAFVGMTLRNDWSSTLPKKNRSFMYPSYSASFIFTELFEKNNILTYGKLRGSWAEVGKDAPAYQTNSYLDPVELTIGGGYKNSWTLGNPNLVPEKTQSFEVGTDLKFFKNKLGLEFTYYNNKSVDQILSPRVDNATGGIFQYVNAGVLQNKGVELTLTTSPIKRDNFSWDVMLNLSHNKGKVKELPGGIAILYVTDVQVADGKAASYNDGDFMAISGKDWTRNDEGKYILNWTTGLPTTNSNSTVHVGNREPKLIGGLNNSFTYKDWNLSFLLDFRKGGDVFNGTEVLLTQYGLSKQTENRGGTISMTGVALNPATNQYEDVTREVVANQDFYTRYYINQTSNFIEKVNWLRLRSVDLSYNLPKSFLARTKVIKGASLNVNATNLFLITNYSGMDPETSAAGAGVIGSGSVGVDYAGVPNTRGFTFGVNLKF
ncbi:SusC/RagA family TonB-linked outer membrane protein [Sphingobacterium psychroaquaticum]|uniref:TonB-linked outer membrane protein, SusC/RagA family n=1 Tax=Sphingobacterium psychroaquaticum TaxID=561061 RepID=A0A1X7KZF1_9SPHI|nr:SusC/RagA family TonB-linked outer membrane protein [Sphingobacterium psychroaquaticum]SMG46780.1 TonB-linked outer membrane protein, SusC/RagA family [Sphingobacterium psychroaquaticum]